MENFIYFFSISDTLDRIEEMMILVLNFILVDGLPFVRSNVFSFISTLQITRKF